MIPIVFALLVWLTAVDPVLAQPVERPFRDCADCPEMIALPAGAFVLGDGGRRAGPPVRVRIERPFAIARTETTWAQYQRCQAAGACPGLRGDHGWGRGRRPVINVPVGAAEAYGRWVSARTGQRYRLPSEAEWEYAAQAGGGGGGGANCRNCGAGRGEGTLPVAQLAPNGWGVFDMLGNVWEWTADCWTPDHRRRDATARARRDGDCRARAVRGGSWYFIARQSRPAARVAQQADQPSYDVGFRLVREAPRSQDRRP